MALKPNLFVILRTHLHIISHTFLSGLLSSVWQSYERDWFFWLYQVLCILWESHAEYVKRVFVSLWKLKTKEKNLQWNDVTGNWNFWNNSRYISTIYKMLHCWETKSKKAQAEYFVTLQIWNVSSYLIFAGMQLVSYK